MLSCLFALWLAAAAPADPTTLYRQAYELIDQGHYLEAGHALRRGWMLSAEGDPLRALLLHGLSIVSQETGNLAQAEEYARRSLLLGPTVATRANFTANLAAVCALRGRKTEAESLFREGLAAADHPALHANYAAFLVTEKRELEALREITSALDATPADTLDRARSLVVLAFCLYRLGDHKGAAKAAGEAAELTIRLGGLRHPVLASVLFLQWRLYRDAGNSRAARDARKRAESIRRESGEENLLGHSVDINTLRR